MICFAAAPRRPCCAAAWYAKDSSGVTAAAAAGHSHVRACLLAFTCCCLSPPQLSGSPAGRGGRPPRKPAVGGRATAAVPASTAANDSCYCRSHRWQHLSLQLAQLLPLRLKILKNTAMSPCWESTTASEAGSSCAGGCAATLQGMNNPEGAQAVRGLGRQTGCRCVPPVLGEASASCTGRAACHCTAGVSMMQLSAILACERVTAARCCVTAALAVALPPSLLLLS